MLPKDLDAVLKDVGKRRCAPCHGGGNVPRKQWVRVTKPELNDFLLAPLAKAAGGTEACGKATFASTDDPDYRRIIATFQSVRDLLTATPRMDMATVTPQ